MRSSPRNSGFILVMVLVVLAVCGAILARAARRNAEVALRAGRVQRELQLRWGALSCRAAVLPIAEQILQEHAGPEEPEPVQVRHTVALGGAKFHLVVGDEQAKANVNALAREEEGVGLLGGISRIVGLGGEAVRVRLLPAEDEIAEDDPTGQYVSFDQVFIIRHPSELMSPPGGEGPAISRRLTCWGNGKLNLKRAELAVLRVMLSGYLSESQLVALDDFRRSAPNLSVPRAFAHLELTKKQIDSLLPLVTDKSGCHSLWVVAEGRTRSWYRLYVEQSGIPEDDPQRWTFAW